MDAYTFFETQPELEKDGICIDYSRLGFRVFIARSGGKNTMWEKEFSKLSEKHKGKDLELVDPKELEDDLMRVFIKSVIRTWQVCEETTDKTSKETKTVWKEGIIVKKPDGSKSVEKPTFDNIRKVLKDLPPLYDDLMKKASDWQLFKKTLEEEEVKN